MVFNCGERGSYIENKQKTMIRALKDTIEKQNKLKKAIAKNTLAPKEQNRNSVNTE